MYWQHPYADGISTSGVQAARKNNRRKFRGPSDFPAADSKFPPVISLRRLFFRAGWPEGLRGTTLGQQLAQKAYKTSQNAILGRRDDFRRLFFRRLFLFGLTLGFWGAAAAPDFRRLFFRRLVSSAGYFSERPVVKMRTAQLLTKPRPPGVGCLIWGDGELGTAFP